MNECSCSQSNVNASWPYKFPRVETKINLAQVLVDHKTIEQSQTGELRIIGSDGASPGQIARISADNTSIEWYTPDHMQADGRTIVKDEFGNIGIIGADNASAGQVLCIGQNGNIEWIDQSISNIDNKTISVTSNGDMQIHGSDTASAMQFLQMQEDGSVKWVTPEYGDMIAAINEKLSGSDGQYLSYSDGSTSWVDGIILQGDWSEENTSSVSYIKNKPQVTSDDDALDFLCEYGYANPVAIDDTTLLTDNSGNIYEY